MGRETINENVKRRLYAESMGRCMNPRCQKELFINDGDIVEKAHIRPYCKDADNSYENLIILCPNCHTEFDKISAFGADEVKSWKQARREELDRIFSEKCSNFDDLKKRVVPLLLENRTIFENYYLGDERVLWDKMEPKILVNNRKLKVLLESNIGLFQSHSVKEYSNVECVRLFIAHIDEFETTRLDVEKCRKILYPVKIDSIFGIEPLQESLLPSTESLEELITKLNDEGKFHSIHLGKDNPYVEIYEDKKLVKLFLLDTPRMRQMYYEHRCFRGAKVRLESLNYALKYMSSRNISFSFVCYNNLREVVACNKKIIFVYEYCLSKVQLLQIAAEEKSVIVNLHNWNGSSCISREAYEVASEMGITLLTMDDFYGYVNRIKNS